MKEAAGSREWPEIRPIRETLADCLQAAVDKLDLTREQTTKIREAHAPFAEKYRAQRAEQHELVQAEFKTISELLTPEQARRHGVVSKRERCTRRWPSRSLRDCARRPTTSA